MITNTEVFVTTIPDCDLCRINAGQNRPAFADARINRTVWANVCEDHFIASSCRLGLGFGQKYVLRCSDD